MNPTRSLLVLAATSLLSAGLIACGSGDDKTTSSAQTPAATTDQTTPTTDTGTTTEETPAPADDGDVITVKGGQPQGGVKKLKAKQGDQVKITVESDQDGEIHLHGYDIMKDAGPGSPAEFDFKADIPGIFTIEVEDTGTEIGELEVS
jgi:hypothetical protein